MRRWIPDQVRNDGYGQEWRGWVGLTLIGVRFRLLAVFGEAGAKPALVNVMPLSVDEKCLRLTDAEGGAGTLLGMRCIDCGVVVFGPATFCQSCSSQRLEEVELSSTGTLYSYTIVRVPPSGWPGPVPYALGEVELPEGPHVLAEVVDCAHDALRIGMAVTLALQAVAMDGVADSERMVYKWRPA